MKYLTKEWYKLCQLTGLHYRMRVHNGVYSKDDRLYERLYKRKERAYIKQNREMYDCDPRSMLESNLIPLEQIFHLDNIPEDKKIVIQRSKEEQKHIDSLIETYDHRPPFDEEHCRRDFQQQVEWELKVIEKQLPSEINNQIADVRMFALGYCTSKIYDELKKYSAANKKQADKITKEWARVRELQSIPESIYSKFNFHDCRVVHIDQDNGKNYSIQLDPSGGFTQYNRVTFVSAEIITEEMNIIGKNWIYDEIYSTLNGYEVHMLFEGGSFSELILNCEDIVIGKEFSGL